MKFGKINNLESISFDLPTDPSVNGRFLAKATPVKTPHIYIGCTGWSMKEWVGKVYPKGISPKAYLRHYGLQFNTIELNTTHYRIPSPEQLDKWIQDTPADFKFCPKLPQVISHRRGLGVGSAAIGAFCQAMETLGDRLGCTFIQLPPYFRRDHKEQLRVFLQAWPPTIPLAVEVRHESWFDHPDHLDEFLALLHAYGAFPVITDVAGRRDVLHMGLTGSVTMVRFVGNDLHPTDYERIDQWVKRLQKWGDTGIGEVYFFLHEPDNTTAPDLSAYLATQIQKHTRFACRGPEFLDNDRGEQMSLF